jgi:hypothetical protein
MWSRIAGSEPSQRGSGYCRPMGWEVGCNATENPPVIQRFWSYLRDKCIIIFSYIGIKMRRLWCIYFIWINSAKGKIFSEE